MDDKEEKQKEDDPYSLKRIYEQMELDLIESFYRNLKKHLKEEKDLGFSWEMWQSAMLRNLEDYRKNTLKITQSYNKEIEKAIQDVLEISYDKGATHVQKQIDLPQDGKNVGQVLSKPPAEQNFFGMNKKKLNALIEATTNDFKEANKAIYRQMDDVYRQVIHNTEFKLSSGAVSLGKAIDLATQDFLSKGINCIIYKNGRRVNVATYAEMALRTASQRATFLGEGAKRDEYGTHLVLISVHANACELCLPWQGEILIDDVFSHPSKEYIANNSKYKLLSAAIKAGFLHPNCRHTLINYVEGVTRIPNKIPSETVLENYKNEQYQRQLENKIRHLKRLAAGTVEPDEKRKYSQRLRNVQGELRRFLAEHPEFKRNRRREQILKNPKTTKLEQNYRPISRSNDSTQFQYSKDVKITAHKVMSYNDDVYVSDKVHIKPMTLHRIKAQNDKIIKEYKIKTKPKVVIFDINEYSGAYGKYDAIENTVYYCSDVLTKGVQQDVDTIRHELWHMKQAESYINKYGVITKENYLDYIAYTCNKAKIFIDKLGITEYNVSEISDYAERMYNSTRYDEVEADYYALKNRKE